jgi:hypothetical protein
MFTDASASARLVLDRHATLAAVALPVQALVFVQAWNSSGRSRWDQAGEGIVIGLVSVVRDGDLQITSAGSIGVRGKRTRFAPRNLARWLSANGSFGSLPLDHRQIQRK